MALMLLAQLLLGDISVASVDVIVIHAVGAVAFAAGIAFFCCW